MAIVFALLPSMLATGGVQPERIWLIGSTGLLVWYVGVIPCRLRQARKLDVQQPMPRPLLAWAVAAALLQVYNLTTPGLPWPYLCGVFSLVVNGFTVFLILLLRADVAHGDAA